MPAPTSSAATNPPFEPHALARAHEQLLDWPELLSRLASLAQSSRGVAACTAVPLARTVAEARAGQDATREMLAILRREGSLPSLSFPEVEPYLDAAERGVALGAEELKQLAAACETAAAARRALARHAELAPGVSALGAALCEHRELIGKARETFDATGEIRDSASPELARLRRERDNLSARTREQAEKLLHSEEFAPYLMDQFVTLREERFVLPVRASFKSMGLGIVHDTSRTGETVFLEPTGVVELNNRLKVAELEIRRESRRILEELAALVAAEAPAVRADVATLTALDVLAAKARLAQACDAGPVEITDDARIDARQLRHPLLVLRAQQERFEVTANDVTLGGSGARVLVISGPNAGGKTVLLKAVGLAALSARAGLLVPAAPGSRIGLFTDVLADIGDQQSVSGDLSTFSAHLANLSGILERAQSAAGGLLVLCDELMAGTNPDQGAALARALLEALAETPALVITTTHYDALKALADGDERFRNAGMEYDLEELRPTFRLRDGQPGRSFALDIAARMGLPESLLDRARALAGAASQGLEDVLRGLEEREEALARQEAALAEAREELEKRVGSEKAAAEALRRREREVAVSSRAVVEAAVRDAREALRKIVQDARRAGTPEAAAAASRAIDTTARAASAHLPPQPALDVAGLKEALAARALGIKPGPKGKPTLSPSKPAPSRSTPAAPPSDDVPLALQTRANTLDVRGQRADEALDTIQSFLDRAALEGAETVFIIHGHGTGALRRSVREFLATSPYVVRFRAGGAGEGGDGVSVATLRG